MNRPPEKRDWSFRRRNDGQPRPLRVLAPVEFDEDSRRSRLTAVELSAQWGAELTLLHVSPQAKLVTADRIGLDAIGLLHNVLRAPAGPAASHEEQTTQLRRLELAAIRRMKRLIPESLRDAMSVAYAWRSGDVPQAIVDYANEHDVDVIILGKRDNPRPWRFGRGISRRVVQTSPCQVLVAYPSGQAAVERLAIEAAAS